MAKTRDGVFWLPKMIELPEGLHSKTTLRDPGDGHG
jgi:hypothetical protein